VAEHGPGQRMLGVFFGHRRHLENLFVGNPVERDHVQHHGPPHRERPRLVHHQRVNLPASSKKMPPFTSTARRAMFDIPAVTAVGVAIANAHGHATSNIDTAVFTFPLQRRQ